MVAALFDALNGYTFRAGTIGSGFTPHGFIPGRFKLSKPVDNPPSEGAAAPCGRAPPGDAIVAILINISAFASRVIAVISSLLAPLVLDTTTMSPGFKSSNFVGGIRSIICAKSGGAPPGRIPAGAGPAPPGGAVGAPAGLTTWTPPGAAPPGPPGAPPKLGIFLSCESAVNLIKSGL